MSETMSYIHDVASMPSQRQVLKATKRVSAGTSAAPMRHILGAHNPPSGSAGNQHITKSYASAAAAQPIRTAKRKRLDAPQSPQPPRQPSPGQTRRYLSPGRQQAKRCRIHSPRAASKAAISPIRFPNSPQPRTPAKAGTPSKASAPRASSTLTTPNFQVVLSDRWGSVKKAARTGVVVQSVFHSAPASPGPAAPRQQLPLHQHRAQVPPSPTVVSLHRSPAPQPRATQPGMHPSRAAMLARTAAPSPGPAASTPNSPARGRSPARHSSPARGRSPGRSNKGNRSRSNSRSRKRSRSRGRRRGKSPARSARGPLAPPTEQLPDIYPENLEVLKNSKCLVLIDLDNWGGFFRKMPEGSRLPLGSAVYGFMNSKCSFYPEIDNSAFVNLAFRGGFMLHALCDQAKNSADFALCLKMGQLDQSLPFTVSFVILSGDAGFNQLYGGTYREGRHVKLIDPHETDPSELPDETISSSCMEKEVYILRELNRAHANHAIQTVT